MSMVCSLWDPLSEEFWTKSTQDSHGTCGLDLHITMLWPTMPLQAPAVWKLHGNSDNSLKLHKTNLYKASLLSLIASRLMRSCHSTNSQTLTSLWQPHTQPSNGLMAQWCLTNYYTEEKMLNQLINAESLSLSLHPQTTFRIYRQRDSLKKKL